MNNNFEQDQTELQYYRTQIEHVFNETHKLNKQCIKLTKQVDKMNDAYDKLTKFIAYLILLAFWYAWYINMTEHERATFYSWK